MTQNHPLYIWQVSNQSLLASATVSPTSPTDGLGIQSCVVYNPGHLNRRHLVLYYVG